MAAYCALYGTLFQEKTCSRLYRQREAAGKMAELDLNPTFSNKNRFNNSSASKSNKITVCVGEGSDPI